MLRPFIVRETWIVSVRRAVAVHFYMALSSRHRSPSRGRSLFAKRDFGFRWVAKVMTDCQFLSACADKSRVGTQALQNAIICNSKNQAALMIPQVDSLGTPLDENLYLMSPWCLIPASRNQHPGIRYKYKF